jgi:hypothetical protein
LKSKIWHLRIRQESGDIIEDSKFEMVKEMGKTKRDGKEGRRWEKGKEIGKWEGDGRE